MLLIPMLAVFAVNYFFFLSGAISSHLNAGGYEKNIEDRHA
jgi:hypothetical protein